MRAFYSSGATFSRGLPSLASSQSRRSSKSCRSDPFPHQPQGSLRVQIAQENIPAEIDLCLVALILGVVVGRWVVIVIHPNDDSEKREISGIATF